MNGYENKSLMKNTWFWNMHIKLELHLIHLSKSVKTPPHTPTTDRRILILKAPTHFLHTSVSIRHKWFVTQCQFLPVTATNQKCTYGIQNSRINDKNIC
jgi:hypothetical protein